MRDLLSRLVLLICLAIPPVTATTASADPGTALAQAEVRGLKVVAAVVQDTDWRAKWQTPRAHVPSFTISDQITLADRPTLLVFFSPPDVPERPQRLDCRLAILENGQVLKEVGPMRCFDQTLTGSPAEVFLTGLVVGIAPEAEDIGTTTRFDVIVEDPDRGIAVPVSVSFNVVRERAS